MALPQWNYSQLPAGVDKQNVAPLLAAAFRDAKATPIITRYSVRGAGMTSSGAIVTGSNHESKAWSDHCEHVVINNALKKRDDPIEMMAIIAGEPGIVATPCGRCRDHLKEYVPEGCYIISASPEGGEVKAVPLREYYFNSFENFKVDLSLPGLREAFFAYQKSFDPFENNTPPEIVYGAALLTRGGIYSAGFIGDLILDTKLPIANASSQHHFGEGSNRFNVQSLVLASRNPIIPLYRDRQQLTNLVDSLRATGIREEPIPVIMVRTDGRTILGSWRTDSDEWMPHPFSARNLGLADVIKREMRKVTG